MTSTTAAFRLGAFVRATCGLSLAAVAVVATCSAFAAPYTHDRLYVRGAVGLGQGWLRGSWMPDGLPEGEGGTSTVRASGLMPELAVLVGGTPRSGLVLGGGVFGREAFSPSGRLMGYHLEDDSQFTLQSFEVVFFTDYYFRPTNGFHIMGSVGPAGVMLASPNLRYSLNTDGFALGIGTGYDFWIAPECSVGPMLALHGSGLMGSGSDSGSGALWSGSLSVAVTYH